MAQSFIGSTITITSVSQIRYEGILTAVDQQEATVSLQDVRMFGTEGRKGGQNEVPPNPTTVYSLIKFRASNILELNVMDSPTPALFVDPAIVSATKAPPAQQPTSIGPNSSNAPPPPAATKTTPSPPDRSILDEIATQRLLDVTIAKTTTPLEPLQQLILQNDAAFGPPLDLYTVFTRTNPDAATPTSPIALAAEFKRASPSKGDIALDVDIATQITTYANAGAALVSVLTEPNWFKGSLQDMQQARSAVEAQFLQATQATHATDATHASTDPSPPHPQRVAVLRKDFIVDEYQLYEARAFGADTVLLIVAILDDRNLTSLLNTARALGMEPLVEVNSIEELHRALAATALVIGVNNRNLHTFQVDLGTTERVARALSFVC